MDWSSEDQKMSNTLCAIRVMSIWHQIHPMQREWISHAWVIVKNPPLRTFILYKRTHTTATIMLKGLFLGTNLRRALEISLFAGSKECHQKKCLVVNLRNYIKVKMTTRKNQSHTQKKKEKKKKRKKNIVRVTLNA